MIMRGGNRLTPRQPLGQIGVGQVEQDFQGRHLGLGKAGKPGRHETADQQIVLMGSTMGGAKQEPPAARLEVRLRLGHG